LLRADTPGADRALFAEADSWLGQPDGAKLRSVRLGRYSLHHAPHSGEYRLYDLKQDPNEQTDIADGHPETLAALRAELDRFDRAPSASAPSTPLSDVETAELRELGYVE